MMTRDGAIGYVPDGKADRYEIWNSNIDIVWIKIFAVYQQNPFLLIMYSIDIKLNCSKGKNLEIFNKGIRVTTNKKKRSKRGKKKLEKVSKKTANMLTTTWHL